MYLLWKFPGVPVSDIWYFCRPLLSRDAIIGIGAGGGALLLLILACLCLCLCCCVRRRRRRAKQKTLVGNVFSSFSSFPSPSSTVLLHLSPCNIPPPFDPLLHFPHLYLLSLSFFSPSSLPSLTGPHSRGRWSESEGGITWLKRADTNQWCLLSMCVCVCVCVCV